MRVVDAEALRERHFALHAEYVGCRLILRESPRLARVIVARAPRAFARGPFAHVDFTVGEPHHVGHDRPAKAKRHVGHASRPSTGSRAMRRGARSVGTRPSFSVTPRNNAFTSTPSDAVSESPFSERKWSGRGNSPRIAATLSSLDSRLSNARLRTSRARAATRGESPPLAAACGVAVSEESFSVVNRGGIGNFGLLPRWRWCRLHVRSAPYSRRSTTY